jgi:AcrR family transcriptional regulator
MPKETFIKLPEDKQERILRTSVSEFTANEFEKGNIGEIAKKAGVAKGSMYQYFENKKELLDRLIKQRDNIIIKKYFGKARIIKAFPGMSSKKYKTELLQIKNKIFEHINKEKNNK